MKSTIRLGRIAGIPIGIHYSWFVVLALFSWSLAARLLPDRYPDWAASTYWATGVVAALLLFASVLVHELAHSVVARARGSPVEGITLFLLGGMSNLQAEAKAARDEFFISAVGPAASLLLFGLLWAAYQAVPDRGAPVAAVVWYLSVVNLVLALFNMVPAFPLDGGRVLRSFLWAATGDRSKATRIASWGGQIVGVLLVALGLFQLFMGSALAGVWYGLVGWFLFSAAAGGREQADLRASLRGVRVGDAMDANPRTVGPRVCVADIADARFLAGAAPAIPVCDDGRLVGILTATDVKRAPQARWPSTSVGDLMTRVPLWSLKPDEPLAAALDVLAGHRIDQAPVLQGDRLVGMLSRADITLHVRRREEPGPGASLDKAGRAGP